MSLRKILEESDPPPSEVVVEYKGQKLTLRANNSAGVFTRAFFVDESEQKLRTMRWRSALKLRGVEATIGEDDVWQILLVHAHLVPEDPEKPYDMVEIAEVFARKGDLFIQLFTAACEVSNITSGDFVGALARKNSEASQPPQEPSRPRRSRQRASR